MELQGQTAIVTGGSKGYGAGIAEALKARGASVWITGRDAGALEATAARLGVRGVRADVTKGADWDRLFERVLGDAGRLDVLVNNAGAAVRVAPLAEQGDEEIERAVAVNLTGQLFGCRRAAKVMAAAGGGTIVNLSSGCQQHAWPGWSVYSAAKAGLAQAGRCLYTELRASGVRVTTVVPYWGATDFADAAGIADSHPLGDAAVRAKAMQPSEMGRLVADICALPPHLAMLDATILPLVQQIEPL